MAESVTETILEEVGDWLADIIARVSKWLWDNFQPVFDEIASWLDNVFGKLAALLDQMKTWIQDVTR